MFMKRILKYVMYVLNLNLTPVCLYLQFIYPKKSQTNPNVQNIPIYCIFENGNIYLFLGLKFEFDNSLCE